MDSLEFQGSVMSDKVQTVEDTIEKFFDQIKLFKIQIHNKDKIKGVSVTLTVKTTEQVSWTNGFVKREWWGGCSPEAWRVPGTENRIER